MCAATSADHSSEHVVWTGSSASASARKRPAAISGAKVVVLSEPDLSTSRSGSSATPDSSLTCPAKEAEPIENEQQVFLTDSSDEEPPPPAPTPSIPPAGIRPVTAEDVAAHNAGDCQPCYFMNSKAGCRGGVTCKFCHLHHELRRHVRPNKKKRERRRKHQEGSDGQDGHSPGRSDDDDRGREEGLPVAGAAANWRRNVVSL